jgi:hypothetical protein
MREACSCGAEIRTLSPRRVDSWRANHIHQAPESTERETDTYSSHELSHQDDWEENRAGFRPNRNENSNMQRARVQVTPPPRNGGHAILPTRTRAQRRGLDHG